MYERFTDRARKVMQLANQEAQRFNHEYIGTEHVLLGLVMEGSGVAAYVLKDLGVDPRKVRLEVEKLVQSGHHMVLMNKLPQTPRAKKVIEYSMEEARNLEHNYVGTEHILLGLLREQEGVAAQVLMNLGLKLEKVREEVLNLLGHAPIDADRDKGLPYAAPDPYAELDPYAEAGSTAAGVARPLPSPLTDSPWFWLMIFSSVSLIALTAMALKYSRRQVNIERQFQGRQEAERRRLAAENEGGEVPVDVPPGGQHELLIPLEPLVILVTLLLAASVAGLVFQWRREQKRAKSKTF